VPIREDDFAAAVMRATTRAVRSVHPVRGALERRASSGPRLSCGVRSSKETAVRNILCKRVSRIVLERAM